MAQPPTPQRVREAIAYFEGKLGRTLTAEEREALQKDVERRAKETAAAALLGLVTLAWKRLEKAKLDGVSIADALSDVSKSVRDGYVGNATKAATRLDLTAKTFVLSALAASRAYAVARKNSYTHQRFDAVMDDVTSEICAECDGTIRPIDDPWWRTHQPPMHHGCRSIITPLTGAEAERMGVTKAPRTSPTAGFGNPSAGYAPQASDYPRALFAAYSRKV